MQMNSGIKLLFDGNINPAERIKVSAGSEPALNQDNINIRNYMVNAYKPRKPWKNATEREIEILTSISESNDFSDTIALISMPSRFKELVIHAGLNDVKNELEFLTLLNENPPALKELSFEIQKFARKISLPGSTILDSGYCLNPSNQETVAYDLRDSCYFGLHIDYSSEFSIARANLSPNRISINLGRDDRYLLFINLSVKAIFSLLESNYDRAQLIKLESKEITKLFFETYSYYPVVKVIVKPFEAYIAPTDNIIHDGSTEGTTSLDISGIIKGFFDPYFFCTDALS
jgi:hypothetical protein